MKLEEIEESRALTGLVVRLLIGCRKLRVIPVVESRRIPPRHKAGRALAGLQDGCASPRGLSPRVSLWILTVLGAQYSVGPG